MKTPKTTPTRSRKIAKPAPPIGLQAVYALADSEANHEYLAAEFADVPVMLLRHEPQSLDEAAVFERITNRYFPGREYGPDHNGPASTDPDHSRRAAYLMGIAMGWYLTRGIAGGGL